MTEDSAKERSAIALTPRIMASSGFDALYREGMSLIEEVAAYLEGDGKAASRLLSREAAFLYATESMRLTTRLMQLASWLLLQRAVNEGEITAEHARSEKAKVKFHALPQERGGPGWDEMPGKMRDYLAKGDRLFERVMQFDKTERGEFDAVRETTTNAVSAQLDRLKAAFGRSE